MKYFDDKYFVIFLEFFKRKVNIGKFAQEVLNNGRPSALEIKKIANEISELQGSVGGDTEQRTPEKMAELISKNLVLFVKNKKDEIVASIYLESFPNGEEEAYVLGGLSSKKVRALTGMRTKLTAILEKHLDKTILARTRSRIANIFLIKMGFHKMSEKEFERRFKKDYMEYMSAQIDNFGLTDGVDSYIREKKM